MRRPQCPETRLPEMTMPPFLKFSILCVSRFGLLDFLSKAKNAGISLCRDFYTTIFLARFTLHASRHDTRPH